jgi:ubiquinone biosynthesis protein
MDATRISMARLLAYLFEVTERFGMETRTELIHLQRTMVVVEGVARSMNPKMNIWEDARPIVEAYIKDSIGPKAIINDLVKTAVVLSRYGSRLPAVAEAAIIRQSNPQVTENRPSQHAPLGWMVSGGSVAIAASWIFQLV